MATSQLLAILDVSMLAYGLIGAVAMRALRLQRDASPQRYSNDPVAWFRYWFPLIIVCQVYVLLGGIGAVLFFELLWSIQLDFYNQLGFALGLGGAAMLCVAADIWLILRWRRDVTRASVGNGEDDTSSLQS